MALASPRTAEACEAAPCDAWGNRFLDMPVRPKQNTEIRKRRRHGRVCTPGWGVACMANVWSLAAFQQLRIVCRPQPYKGRIMPLRCLPRLRLGAALSWSLWGWFSLLLVQGSPSWAQQPVDANEFQQAVEAGEFGPAFEMAAGANGADRDAFLGALAQAQARAGARRAAAATASMIDGGRARAAALGETREQPLGGQGGGVQPDFESLIELIKETITKEPGWTDDGGTGAIREFPGGVYVDAEGVLQRTAADSDGGLARVRAAAAAIGSNRQARIPSPLRKVSLPRLERAIQVRLALGQPLDQEMLVLAGLNKIQYVLVYPETGDVVLAGPAGDWAEDQEGRLLDPQSRRPVLRLDDLLVLLRHTYQGQGSVFGCTLEPTQQGLAAAQQYIKQTTARPLKPAQRDAWLEEIRRRVGLQKAAVFGIDPRTRVAQILLEADYRMKLVGLGLEPSVLEVPSYLELVVAERTASPMSVLRWWFTLNYDAIIASRNQDAYELRGQGVKLLSENELLTATGQRVHTGESDVLNQEFARRFTKHFASLAAKYPIYAELQNLFDLALAASLIRTRDLPGQVGWELTSFLNADELPTAQGPLPQAVDTVMNYKIVGRTRIVAAVSGGVQVDTRSLVAPESIQIEGTGRLNSERLRAAPEQLPHDRWWWD